MICVFAGKPLPEHLTPVTVSELNGRETSRVTSLPWRKGKRLVLAERINLRLINRRTESGEHTRSLILLLLTLCTPRATLKWRG